MNKILFYIFFGLIATYNVNGQPYYFRHYQVENGLSNNTVNFIRQDSKGFMWFATKDGLNRFDGSTFKVFRMNSSASNKSLNRNYIYSILPGKEGCLLVGAEKGLYRFDPQKERLEVFIDSVEYAYDLTMSPTGELWFISGGTACRYNVTTKKLTRFTPDKFFNATSLCITEEGNLWISSDNGFLNKYNPESGSFTKFDIFSHSPKPSSRFIQKIKNGSNNSIFVGTTAQGLKIFDANTSVYKDVLTYNPDKTTIFVRDILQSSRDEYWIATESGIFIYDQTLESFTNLKKKFLDPYSLNDNAIYTLFKDAEGGIWAGTFFGGVNYYAKRNASFIKYFPDNSPNSISGSSVREICKDQYNNLWVGSEDGGLSKINSKTNSIEVFKPTGKNTSITYPNIHGLLADGNDLWIGTFEHGIDIMDITTGQIRKRFRAGTGPRDIESNFALCFYRTKADQILVGTVNGLFYFNRKTSEFTRPKQIPGNIFVTSIMEDHNNVIWLGTSSQGVYWFDPVTNVSGRLLNDAKNTNSLSNNSVNDVFEDHNNNIWMSTEGGGLCKLGADRKTFTRYTIEKGLPANFVFKVLEDKNKNLWASTSKGLINFDPDFQDLHVYTKSNGLLTDQFNYHSGFRDDDGRLYFGSVKGMISFMPDNFQKSNFIPPLYLTGIQAYNNELSPEKDSSIMNKSIIYADEITLPYDQSTISIDFAALSYVSPEMTLYKYRLDGLEKDWTTIQTVRKVYFTNLPPGRYVFNVKASANGTWNSEAKRLIIEITPPFWSTWWAYSLYSILIVLLAYYVMSNYKKRLHEKKLKEIYESKIDFFTNVAHEIKTPLTLIKGPVENLMEKKDEVDYMKEDLECLERNTKRLTDLVSQILDFRQTEIKHFTLDLEKVNLSQLLKETVFRFKILASKNNLDYKLELPDNDIFIMADEDALQKIISNLINNAIKYGEKKVSVKLHDLQRNEKQEDVAVIEFENDGYMITPADATKIFEPFYRIANSSHKKGTGIGLTLSRSLAELHEGRLDVTFVKKDYNVFKLILPSKIQRSGKVKPLEKQTINL